MVKGYFVSFIFLGGCLLGVEGAITGITQTVGSSGVTVTALVNKSVKDTVLTLTLAENFAVGNTITTLTINGAASPLTWTIDTADYLLAVADGVVKLATGKSFDYETSPSVQSVVKAVDSANPSETATVTLSFSVTNIDDNTPVFAPATYAVTIPKDSGAGTTLVTVTATDPDGNAIAYSIASGNTNTDWIIGSSGIITVAAGKKIEEATYKLVVRATDDGTQPMTGSTTVAVTVSSGYVVGVSVIALFGLLLCQLL